MWQNSKPQIVTKHKNLNFTTQIVTKPKISNCDKTQKHKLWQNSIYEKKNKLKKGLLVRTFWHPDNWWDVLWAAFCDSRKCFLQNGLPHRFNIFLFLYIHCLMWCRAFQLLGNRYMQCLPIAGSLSYAERPHSWALVWP